MTIDEQLDRFANNIAEFSRCIESLPEDRFLAKVDEWSPRDIVAHLIGWNRYTILGCQAINRGEIPFYLDDPGVDFSKANAVFLQRYPSTDRRTLLEDLEMSFQELKRFIASLELTEWQADRDVRYEGESMTIKNAVDAISADYIQHKQQIEGWINQGAAGSNVPASLAKSKAQSS